MKTVTGDIKRTLAQHKYKMEILRKTNNLINKIKHKSLDMSINNFYKSCSKRNRESKKLSIMRIKTILTLKLDLLNFQTNIIRQLGIVWRRLQRLTSSHWLASQMIASFTQQMQSLIGRSWSLKKCIRKSIKPQKIVRMLEFQTTKSKPQTRPDLNQKPPKSMN